MRTKALVAGFGVALMAAPFIASATSVNDLEAQISALLAQVHALQMQAHASSTVSVSTESAPIISTQVCSVFFRSLLIGSSGSDVRSLQNFLHAQGDLKASATGYFGALTKTALGKWQANNGITTSGSVGFGIFGPLSRSFFGRSCGGTTGSRQPFSANPQSGAAPLTVAFTTSDSITASSTTYSVDFGDGSTTAMAKGECIAIMAIVGGQGGIRCSYAVSHTYSVPDTYTATITSSMCSCPANGVCNCPNIRILGSATVTVNGVSTSSTSSIQQLNAPGSVTLPQNGIAEIRNESYYFMLTGLTSTTATIQITPVGCWNSFPSDTPPRIRCMIATLLIPPQTLSVGQTTNAANKAITLNSITNAGATFTVGVPNG